VKDGRASKDAGQPLKTDAILSVMPAKAGISGGSAKGLIGALVEVYLAIA
jgi:hypothetical protein